MSAAALESEAELLAISHLHGKQFIAVQQFSQSQRCDRVNNLIYLPLWSESPVQNGATGAIPWHYRWSRSLLRKIWAALVLIAQPKARYTQLQEYRYFELNALRLTNPSKALSVTVTVVSRGSLPFHPRFKQMEESWVRLQWDLLGLSARAYQIIAADGGHAVHMERPALLAYAISSALLLAQSPERVLNAWALPEFQHAALFSAGSEPQGFWSRYLGIVIIPLPENTHRVAENRP